TTRQWDRNVGRTGTSWPFDRHDGSHVFFMHLNDLDNAVIRMGGADVTLSTATSTDSSELCFAGEVGAGWISLGAIPGGPRAFLNAVILPDAAIAVIGGANRPAPQAGTPIRMTAVYQASTGWCRVAPSGDSPSIRGYHATAVLLGDGRVFVGGGEAGDPSDSDYDIYEPHYLAG